MKGGVSVIVILFIVRTILSSTDSRYPLHIHLVPINGLPQAIVQRYGRRPAQLASNFVALKSVASIMTGTISYRREQRLRLAHQPEQAARYAEILFYIETADVVDLSNPASLKNRQNAAAIVVYMQPVALLLPVTVNRERLVIERIRNQQRQELFGELKRAIVV